MDVCQPMTTHIPESACFQPFKARSHQMWHISTVATSCVHPYPAQVVTDDTVLFHSLLNPNKPLTWSLLCGVIFAKSLSPLIHARTLASPTGSALNVSPAGQLSVGAGPEAAWSLSKKGNSKCPKSGRARLLISFLILSVCLCMYVHRYLPTYLFSVPPKLNYSALK